MPAPSANSYVAADRYIEAATHFSAGRWSDCRDALQGLLADQPERLEAIHLAALAALQDQRLAEAREYFRRLLQTQAADAAACCRIGIEAETGGLVDLAEAAFRQALAGRPDDLEARYRWGQLCERAGRSGEAEAAYREVILGAPQFADAYIHLGAMLQDLGRWEEAETALRQAQRLDAPVAASHYYLGLGLARSGRSEEAEAEYRRALALNPNLLDALEHLAGEFKTAGRWTEAEAVYRQLLRLRPDSAEAYNNLALLLMELGRKAEAETLFHHALHEQPAFATAMHNLSCLLKRQGRVGEAAEWCGRALALQPDYAAALNQRGILAMEDGRFDAAAADFLRVLDIAPTEFDAAWNLGLLRLLQGDFAAGWAGYEYRWQAALKNYRRDFEQPMWDGRPFPQRTLLIHCEQGWGDSVQFVRYLPGVAALGGTLWLECPNELIRLFSCVDGIGRLIPHGEAPPAFDLQCPLLSLPYVLNTRLETIPAPTAYLAAPAAARATMPVLAPSPDRPLKVGLVWAGNPEHHNNLNRSIAFDFLAPLFVVPGLTWVILQKEHRPANFEALAAGRGWLDPLPGARDFADTAAIIEQLDLVIGVDTSSIHLAGALGKPVWMLTPFNPDWRWLLEREDSPWYPSLRLFRQARRNAWPDVIERVATALAAWAAELGVAFAPVLEVKEYLPSAAVSSAMPRTIRQVAVYQRLLETKHGTFLYNANDVYIGRVLETYGEYCEHEVALFQNLLRPGDTAIDAGAHIGALTVPMATAVGMSGEVWAFEPQPVVFHTLCANLALNALENVRAYPYALGRRRGNIGVPRLDYAVANNFGGISLPGADAVAQRGCWVAPLARLDDVCTELTPRLIKIDVEGMERDVLLGAERLIDRARPLLYVENDRLEHSADLIRLLRRWRYCLYWHTPPMFNPNNYFGYPGNPYGTTLTFNMLGVPAEHPLVIRGLSEVGAEYEHPLLSN